MRPATPPPGCEPGRYSVVFSSAVAESEWDAFATRNPDAARDAYTRLSTEPLTRQPGRQFPLKGKANKPFWEYEATGGDRIYYAVCLDTQTVIVAVRNDTHKGAEVTAMIMKRAKAIKRFARDRT